MMVNVAAEGTDPDIEAILEGQKVQCLLPYSVHDEASRPNCPPGVRRAVSRFLYTINTGPLTAPEQADARAFFAAQIRNAKPENILRDLFHVWEAAKYGGDFFITRDTRLLSRADAIHAHKGIWVVSKEEAARLHEALVDEDH
jgi:hypothetical protein